MLLSEPPLAQLTGAVGARCVFLLRYYLIQKTTVFFRKGSILAKSVNFKTFNSRSVLCNIQIISMDSSRAYLALRVYQISQIQTN